MVGSQCPWYGSPRRPRCVIWHMMAATVFVNTLRELLQIGNNFVVADVKLLEDRGRIRRDIRRAAEHCQADPAFGLFFMVALIALFRHAAFFEPAGVARAHASIAERHVTDGQRLK